MTIDLQIRKMFNGKKVIHCSAQSYQSLQQEQSNYLHLIVNGNWITYEPTTQKQINKIRNYNNYKLQQTMR